MPTPRSPDVDKRGSERKEAERLFLDSKGSIKLVDIAQKLGVPDAKIRKWKSMDDWEGKLHPSKSKESKKKQVERFTKQEGSVPRKRGAPLGNHNAVGHGAPEGNSNAFKHGAYSNVYMSVLDDEEKELLEQIPTDEEKLLMEQIQFFTIREIRITKAINKYRRTAETVALNTTMRTERKRTFDGTKEEKQADEEEYTRRVQEKIASGDRMPGREYSTTTTTENKDNIIARLESELSNVSAKKTKAIEALAKLRLEKQKLDGENKGNEVVRAWAERVVAMRGGADREK